jgi:hypothetical protein
MSKQPSDPIEPGAVVLARDQNTSAAVARVDEFMPLFTVEQAVTRKQMVNQFIGQVLNEGGEAGEGDYGVMPGSKKKVLFKPGAEKLCSIFGLAPRYVDDKIVEDWTGDDHGGEPLFYYRYRCQLYRGDRFMGEAIGSANSWEAKYRYRWVREEDVPARLELDRLPVRGGERTIFEPDFALEKKETGGKYGKPAEYWDRFDNAIGDGSARATTKKLGTKSFKGYEITFDETLYRVPNPDGADVINTCQKIAQKRALVAAVLVVTNASDSFTQDLEDFQQPGAGAHGGDTGFDPPANPGEMRKSNGKPAAAAGPIRQAAAVPEELAAIFARLERNPQQFGEAVKLFEDRLVEKFGTVEGLKRYDAVSDAFYAAHPRGTTAINELKAVIVRLHSELERPLETAEAEAVA